MRLRLSRELLDDDRGTAREIARSLDDLWWIHRRMGGVASWRRLWMAALRRRVSPERGSISLLDVGSGTGQVAAAHAGQLRARGWAVTPVVLDRRASHLQPRGGAGIDGALRVAGDGFHLPFVDASFDFVTCNLFLHHFHDRPGDPRASLLLAEMLRVARGAVVINDLERSWWPWLAFQALRWRFGRITRYDGPRSVRQAYTPSEIGELARTSGAVDATVVQLPLYRLGLILWSGSSPDVV